VARRSVGVGGTPFEVRRSCREDAVHHADLARHRARIRERSDSRRDVNRVADEVLVPVGQHELDAEARLVICEA
jgi:hypothetical protein